MTAQHACGWRGPLGRELVDDVRAEAYHWLDLHYPDNGRNVAERMAILNIVEELDDHLIIRFAATLASHGVSS